MATSTALPLPSGAGVTSAPAVVAAGPGDVEEDEFEPQDLDTVSAATTSITSSIYQHQFENGRRVRSSPCYYKTALNTNMSVGRLSTTTIRMGDIPCQMMRRNKIAMI